MKRKIKSPEDPWQIGYSIGERVNDFGEEKSRGVLAGVIAGLNIEDPEGAITSHLACSICMQVKLPRKKEDQLQPIILDAINKWKTEVHYDELVEIENDYAERLQVDRNCRRRSLSEWARLCAENAQHLERWVEFLDQQMAVFEARIDTATGGRPRQSSRTWVAFLQVDAALMKANIDEAIVRFSNVDEWPVLNDREWLHLLFRAFSARGFLRGCLDDRIKAKELKLLRAPSATDSAKFIRWLLIDLWNAAFLPYLDEMSTDFLGP